MLVEFCADFNSLVAQFVPTGSATHLSGKTVFDARSKVVLVAFYTRILTNIHLYMLGGRDSVEKFEVIGGVRYQLDVGGWQGASVAIDYKEVFRVNKDTVSVILFQQDEKLIFAEVGADPSFGLESVGHSIPGYREVLFPCIDLIHNR